MIRETISNVNSHCYVKFFHEKSICMKIIDFLMANSAAKTFRNTVRNMLFNTDSPFYVKFWNEKLISISYKAFRNENHSFSEFCFDIVEKDVFELMIELRWILPRKFDFDKNCSFSTPETLLQRNFLRKRSEWFIISVEFCPILLWIIRFLS